MEITITQLADETGLSISHICQLIKRGQCPPGRKEGKQRYLPEGEARMALLGCKSIGPRKKAGDWTPGPQPTKAQFLTLEDLI